MVTEKQEQKKEDTRRDLRRSAERRDLPSEIYQENQNGKQEKDLHCFIRRTSSPDYKWRTVCELFILLLLLKTNSKLAKLNWFPTNRLKPERIRNL